MQTKWAKFSCEVYGTHSLLKQRGNNDGFEVKMSPLSPGKHRIGAAIAVELARAGETIVHRLLSTPAGAELQVQGKSLRPLRTLLDGAKANVENWIESSGESLRPRSNDLDRLDLFGEQCRHQIQIVPLLKQEEL